MTTKFTVYSPVIRDLRFEKEDQLEPNDESYVFFTVENKNTDLTIRIDSFYFTISYAAETRDFIGEIARAPVDAMYTPGQASYRKSSSISTYDERIIGMHQIEFQPQESKDFRYELKTQDRNGNQLKYPTDAEFDVTCSWYVYVGSHIDEELIEKHAFKISKD